MRTIGTRELLLLFCYAVLYIITRELSLSHWLLSSGLRFIALLFLPFRYWPYVLVADCAGSLYFRAYRLSEYGPLWLASAVLLPPVTAAIPIAHLRSLKWMGGETKLSTMCLQLLRTAGLVSALTAVSNVIGMLLITYSPKVPAPRESPLFYLCDFTLGNYLGILMMAPAAMTWIVSKRTQYQSAAAAFRSSTRDFAPAVAGVALFVGILLVVNRESASMDVQRMAGMAMLIPTVWMTFRRGWVGAVAATILASTALELTMRGFRDIDQLQTQALLGLVATGMLLLGATITESELKIAALGRLTTLHRGLARKNLHWGEARMRQSATIVERAFGLLQSYVDDATLQLRSSRASEAGALIRWQGTASVRPEIDHTIALLDARPLHVRGLRVALAYGPLAQTLGNAGISYSVRVDSGVHELPHDMQLTLYRLTYDVALHLAREHSAYRVAARLCSYRTTTRNVALVVKAWPSLGDKPPLPPGTLDLEDVENTALTFGGIYHHRKRRRRPTIGVVLRDV